MNSQHLSRLSGMELLPRVADRLVDAGLTTPAEIADRRDWFARLMELLKPRARYLDDFVPQARPFLAPRVDYEPAAVAKHWKDPEETRERLGRVADALHTLSTWEPERIEAELRAVADREGVGFGKVVHPLRLALTGAAASPGIDQVVATMGRDLVLRRLGAAREALDGLETKEVDGLAAGS